MGIGQSSQIWVVDDDPEQLCLLSSYLSKQGYVVRSFACGEQMMVWLHSERPDLLVLDVMLPGDDGFTLLRRLRDEGDPLPVVMLTAKADPVDRIIGLEQGADDYLGKPFLPRELTARIEAVLRRSVSLPEHTPHGHEVVMEFGDNVLDLILRNLHCGGRAVPLTNGEFSLLRVFALHPFRPMSRQMLIELTRGPDSETDARSMDVQVSRLRKLIETDSTRPRYIQTVWGFGYMFVPDGNQISR